MALSAIAFLLIWEFVLTLFFDPTVLPSPTAIFDELLTIFELGGPRGRSAWYHVQMSLNRVVIGGVLAMGIAVLLGVSMGINDHLEDALSVWLPFWMTVPTVVVVLIAMIVFQFSQLSIITAVVFAATPYATVNIWKAVDNIDSNLLEMAKSFDLPMRQVWRHIYLPSILPSLFGSLRYLLGMVWKIVVLAEVFGLDNGMGAMFRFWYTQGSMVTLLAYLAIFLAVMFLIEYGILYPLEQRLFRWRDA